MKRRLFSFLNWQWQQNVNIAVLAVGSTETMELAMLVQLVTVAGKDQGVLNVCYF